MTIRLVFVPSRELSRAQRLSMKKLETECFGSLSRRELKELFFARSFGSIFAYEGEAIRGYLKMCLRRVSFEGAQVSLAGISKVCVTASARHRGIASRMVMKALEVFKAKGCDVASLASNLKGSPRALYHRLGFRLMERRFSFEDVHGKLRFADYELFLPVCSREIYDRIMKSSATFHLGRGIW